MKRFLIKNASLVNEGNIVQTDVLLQDGRIERVDPQISVDSDHEEINAQGLYLLPGLIDDQVHFREPGLTHKADIHSESRAAVAGGVTSFMEMPNTIPPALTIELLEEKYSIASRNSLANYSFFMGASNENIEELQKVDPKNICGVKVFMGSSTGNMLVDNEQALSDIFEKSPVLVATHCEDEATVLANLEKFKAEYGEEIPFSKHPEIRNVEACLLSSQKAVELAKKFDTRLHILHISTKDELALFESDTALENKKITAEACVHHLWFDDSDYERLQSRIKCNPAIKSREHKEGIWQGLMDGKLDFIATDHAPHTLEEKENKYLNAPAGLPLIQHSLNMMLEFYQKEKFTLEDLVQKMCHAPALCYRLSERGFIREGYWADLVLVDPESNWKVESSNLLYKCGWSPLEGHSFKGHVTHTFVNGHLAFRNETAGVAGSFDESVPGKRLQFER
ncbi:MAG: dihydroorotase [Bacteroidetes bacterium]|nr:dihydroorotase [Bacteroidota bacterium]